MPFLIAVAIAKHSSVGSFMESISTDEYCSEGANASSMSTGCRSIGCPGFCCNPNGGAIAMGTTDSIMINPFDLLTEAMLHAVSGFSRAKLGSIGKNFCPRRFP